MKKICLFTVLLFIILASCDHKSPELPEKRPADFKLNYHVDGGMSDYSVQIDIAGDSCHYHKRQEGKVFESSFKLAESDKDALYSMLKKNNFDKILYTKEQGTVHDRGGVSVSAEWDKNKITVSDAQNSFVKEDSYEQWRNVCEGIDSFISSRAEKARP